jgi:hypothetical protein
MVKKRSLAIGVAAAAVVAVSCLVVRNSRQALALSDIVEGKLSVDDATQHARAGAAGLLYPRIEIRLPPLKEDVYAQYVKRAEATCASRAGWLTWYRLAFVRDPSLAAP